SVPLVIAGGGNSKVFYDQGLTDEQGVKILGRGTDAELKALYSEAKALVFPSKTEGFGLPPLEAMFCGCPVIATTGGAVPEVCGDAALYARPDEPAEWTAAMEKLTHDTTLCDDLSPRGLVRAAQFTRARAA
ncbi:glycosyltransferase, partial [Micrococcus sp. SIMBA_144]